MNTVARSVWKRAEHNRGGRPRGDAPNVSTNPAVAVVLVLASTAAALLFCEIGIRLLRAARSSAIAGIGDRLLDAGDAMRYVWKLPAAPGTDRRWFLEDPPALPNRTQVSPQRFARYQDFERRGIFTFQADYLWNRYFVESQRCGPDSFFQPWSRELKSAKRRELVSGFAAMMYLVSGG